MQYARAHVREGPVVTAPAVAGETGEQRRVLAGVIGVGGCRIAAVVAERPEAEEAALDSYGRNLGIAFQLADDAIDYDSDAAEMGKTAGDDFREGKMTLPVILAYARGSESERDFWRHAIAGDSNSDADLAHAIGLIRQHDAVQATRERARHYANRAIDAIAAFPGGAAKAAMIEAAEFAVSRRF